MRELRASPKSKRLRIVALMSSGRKPVISPGIILDLPPGCTPMTSWPGYPEYRKRVKDAIVSVRNSSPIPGLGVAGGFKIMVEDRGGRGLTDLQTETDLLTRRLQEPARSGRRSDRVPLQRAVDLPGHRPDQGRRPGSARSRT